jgi:hypothetical protein
MKAVRLVVATNSRSTALKSSAKGTQRKCLSGKTSFLKPHYTSGSRGARHCSHVNRRDRKDMFNRRETAQTRQLVPGTQTAGCIPTKTSSPPLEPGMTGLHDTRAMTSHVNSLHMPVWAGLSTVACKASSHQLCVAQLRCWLDTTETIAHCQPRNAHKAPSSTK